MFKQRISRSLLLTGLAAGSLLLAAGGAWAAQGSSGVVGGAGGGPQWCTGSGRGRKVEQRREGGYNRTTQSDANGQFKFFNVPFNTYRIVVDREGFQKFDRKRRGDQARWCRPMYW